MNVFFDYKCPSCNCEAAFIHPFQCDVNLTTIIFYIIYTPSFLLPTCDLPLNLKLYNNKFPMSFCAPAFTHSSRDCSQRGRISYLYKTEHTLLRPNDRTMFHLISFICKGPACCLMLSLMYIYWIRWMRYKRMSRKSMYSFAFLMLENSHLSSSGRTLKINKNKFKNATIKLEVKYIFKHQNLIDYEEIPCEIMTKRLNCNKKKKVYFN